jgi:hypothetical protein
VSGAGWTARYEVRVQGMLDGRWSQWLGGLQVSSEGGESALSGTLPDQSALHGVLDKVFDLGLAVVTVRRLPPEELGGERR